MHQAAASEISVIIGDVVAGLAGELEISAWSSTDDQSPAAVGDLAVRLVTRSTPERPA
jgi:hypothetical protein